MSRSGYSDDIDNYWQIIRWRGAVASALRGRRGQAFLRELIAALDALPLSRLVANTLTASPELDVIGASEYCALGAVGRRRAMDMTSIDPDDHESVAVAFDVAHAMACEIMWLNDEGSWRETPEQRWSRIRAWAVAHLKE